jgi:hypothetical protein
MMIYMSVIGMNKWFGFKRFVQKKIGKCFIEGGIYNGKGCNICKGFN